MYKKRYNPFSSPRVLTIYPQVINTFTAAAEGGCGVFFGGETRFSDPNPKIRGQMAAGLSFFP
jgi:hypothetical protein